MDAFLRTRLSDLVSRGGHCCLLQEHGSGDDNLRTQCRKIGESGELWGPTERRGPRPQRKWWGGCVTVVTPAQSRREGRAEQLKSEGRLEKVRSKGVVFHLRLWHASQFQLSAPCHRLTSGIRV